VQGAYWARAAGCNATPRTITRDRLIHWTWSCPAGIAVELFQVTDGAHAWPGGSAGRRRADPPSNAIDATAAMWEFFKTRTADGRR
jgi:polyhydroxybutyrate depolymerase